VTAFTLKKVYFNYGFNPRAPGRTVHSGNPCRALTQWPLLSFCLQESAANNSSIQGLEIWFQSGAAHCVFFFQKLERLQFILKKYANGAPAFF
jgi:hypothetical protein